MDQDIRLTETVELESPDGSSCLNPASYRDEKQPDVQEPELSGSVEVTVDEGVFRVPATRLQDGTIVTAHIMMVEVPRYFSSGVLRHHLDGRETLTFPLWNLDDFDDVEWIHLRVEDDPRVVVVSYNPAWRRRGH